MKIAFFMCNPSYFFFRIFQKKFSVFHVNFFGRNIADTYRENGRVFSKYSTSFLSFFADTLNFVREEKLFVEPS